MPKRVEHVLGHYVTIGPRSECWPWKGSRMSKGYGYFMRRENGKQKNYNAHRFVYELLKGKIPDGLQLDHLCRNRICVNPDHLEPVTHRENLLRGNTLASKAANKTHCSNGHGFTPENTRTYNAGWRKCRTCDRIRAWNRRKPQAEHKLLTDSIG